MQREALVALAALFWKAASRGILAAFPTLFLPNSPITDGVWWGR